MEPNTIALIVIKDISGIGISEIATLAKMKEYLLISSSVLIAHLKIHVSNVKVDSSLTTMAKLADLNSTIVLDHQRINNLMDLNLVLMDLTCVETVRTDTSTMD